jgi:hypothetical protein
VLQRWIRNASIALAVVIVPSVSAQALQAVLSSSRAEYGTTDEVTLEVKLVNVSSEPVTLWGKLMWGYAGGFVLRAFEESGSEVQRDAYDDDLLIPSMLGDPTNFVKLAPNHLLGILRKDRASDLFRKPGEYRLRVEYRSPVPLKYKNQSDFWSTERGVVSSEFIHLRITPAQTKSAK